MDYIIVDGDKAVFEDKFGAAKITVQDGTMIGSGHGTIDGAPVCIEGDEAKVIVGPVPYETDSHKTPGMGLLTIDALGSDQVASQTTDSGTPVILLGSEFDAKFAVSVPAMTQSSPPQPDSFVEYKGKGAFDNANDKIRGT